MSVFQQILVIIIALTFSVYVVYKVRAAKLDLRHAIIWLVIAVGLLFVAVFPKLVIRFASLLRFEASTTMIFIVATALLALITFRQTLKISALEKRVINLTQSIALLDNEKENRDKS